MGIIGHTQHTLSHGLVHAMFIHNDEVCVAPATMKCAVQQHLSADNI